MNASNSLPEITLDELERLIRLLGLLGSAHDGEVVAAARFAQKWVREHDTDWRTLLTPPEEPSVSGVVATPDTDALLEAQEADRAQAFKNGYQAGMQAMAAQVKAQANLAAGRAATQPPHWTTMAGSGPGSPVHGTGGQPGANQGQGAPNAPGGPVAGSGPLAGGYPASSWQAVCAELLDRNLSVPGVFRGSREQDFVESLLARGWASLTGPQENWLRDIATRAGLSW